MDGQIGSTFGGTGFGGPIVILLYFIWGPVFLIIHSSRLLLHIYAKRTNRNAFSSPTAREAARSWLPWNIGIALIPLLPKMIGMFSHSK
jgi:hypothetical protein